MNFMISPYIIHWYTVNVDWLQMWMDVNEYRKDIYDNFISALLPWTSEVCLGQLQLQNSSQWLDRLYPSTSAFWILSFPVLAFFLSDIPHSCTCRTQCLWNIKQTLKGPRWKLSKFRSHRIKRSECRTNIENY